MKYILINIFFTLSLFASDINWPSDYNKALVEAKKENKYIYVFITSDSCRWCRKFEATTLQDEYIKERLDKEFVHIQLSRDEHDIPKMFETAPVPRHYFLDSNGNILYNSLGYRGVACLDGFMDNAIEKDLINKKGNINEISTNK